ncbi:MAG: hypothetical protein IJO91_05215 [Oscillospiraceae bacterium]|nr:hypothetical protein [Oscillospiraceae bacterium]
MINNGPFDIPTAERRLLSSLRKRPAMYLGKKSLTRFEAWYHGYEAAIVTAGLSYYEHNILPDGKMSIHDYAAEKYLGKGKESTCGWINCIRTFEPDDTKALDVCFEFLDEYLIHLGFEPVPDWDEEHKKFYAENFGE